MSLNVLAVPCRRDNYAYLAWQPGATECLVVDPSEAEPVRAALRQRGLSLAVILNTHHHPDHTGGNAELAQEWGAPVYAHERDKDRIPALTHTLVDGQQLEVLGTRFSIFHLPGHTEGAIVYATPELAFTGDTLFCAGCGRLKEGTAAQLHASLQRLTELLGPDVVCYTGHEYTEANLLFALSLEPNHGALVERLARVREQRSRGACTAFARLELELATNPFLRVAEPGLRAALDLPPAATDAEVFTELRRRKDDF